MDINDFNDGNRFYRQMFDEEIIQSNNQLQQEGFQSAIPSVSQLATYFQQQQSAYSKQIDGGANSNFNIANIMTSYEQELINQIQNKQEDQRKPNRKDQSAYTTSNNQKINRVDHQFSFKGGDNNEEELQLSQISREEIMNQEMIIQQQPMAKGLESRQRIALINDDEDEGEGDDVEEEKVDKSTEEKFQFKNDQSFSDISNLGNFQGNDQEQSPDQREALGDISDDTHTVERMEPMNNMTMGMRLNLGEIAVPIVIDVQQDQTVQSQNQSQNMSHQNTNTYNIIENEEQTDDPNNESENIHTGADPSISQRVQRMRDRHRHRMHDAEDLGEEHGEDIGEDASEKDHKSEREDTEIDFIQQVDTDRQALNPDHDVNLYQPVNSENQIQIQSKHQVDINTQIMTKQHQKMQQLSQFGVKKEDSGCLNLTVEQSSKKSLDQPKFQTQQNDPKYTEVFVWGDDSCGQLGLELHKKIMKFDKNAKQVSFYKTPKSCSFNVLIKQIACGESHSAMLTISGHLYMMGSNKFGQLGIGIGSPINEINGNSSKESQSQSEFQGTFSQNRQNLALPGSQQYEDSSNIRAPCLVEALKHLNISKIDCGGNYTIVMSEQKKRKSSTNDKQTQLYCWGDNRYSQLGMAQFSDQKSGTGHKQNKPSLSEMVRRSNQAQPITLLSQCQPEPAQVANMQGENIIDFSCGENFSLFLTEQKVATQNKSEQPNIIQNVYSCGLNSSGQCGHPILPSAKIDSIKAPTKMNLPKSLTKISQISAGVNHSLFLSQKTGFVYQCGGVFSDSTSFKEVLIHEPICKIEAKIHSSALSFNGNLYLWTNDDNLTPKTQIKNVKDISLSNNFAIIIDNNDKKFSWGKIQELQSNSIVQHSEPFFIQHSPVDIKNLNSKQIKSITCGDQFVIALGRDVTFTSKQPVAQKRSLSHSKKMNGSGTRPPIIPNYDEIKQDEITARRQTAQFQNSSSANRVPNVNLIPLLKKKQELQDKLVSSNQRNSLIQSQGSTLNLDKKSQNASSNVRQQSKQTGGPKKKRNTSNVKNLNNNNIITSSRVKQVNHRPQISHRNFSNMAPQNLAKRKDNKNLQSSSSQNIQVTNIQYKLDKGIPVRQNINTNSSHKINLQPKTHQKIRQQSALKKRTSSNKFGAYNQHHDINTKQRRHQQSIISNKSYKSHVSVKSSKTAKSGRSLRSYTKCQNLGGKQASLSSHSKTRSASRSKSALMNKENQGRGFQSFDRRTASISSQPKLSTSINGVSSNVLKMQRRARSPLSDNSPQRQQMRQHIEKQPHDTFLEDFSPVDLISANQNLTQNDFSPQLKDLKLKTKQQQNEIKSLIDDNIHKENNIFRLRNQVERYKKGLPYNSPSLSDNGSHDANKSKPAVQSRQDMEQKDTEIKQLKLKQRKQNNTIRILREKLEAAQQKDLKQLSSFRAKSPLRGSLNTHDLFIVNEENCRLNDQLNQLQKQVCDSDSLLIDKNHQIDKLNWKIEKQSEQIKFKDNQLSQATKELDDLQGGISEFQEQTHMIQQELINQVRDLKLKLKEQANTNQNTQYDLQLLNDKTNLNEKIKECEKLKKEVLNKEKHISRVENKNLEFEEALRVMQSKMEKQTYNDFINKVGLSRSRISQSPTRDYKDQEIRKSRSPTPDQSPRNDQSRSRHSRDRVNASYDKSSMERINLKSGLKEMVSDKLRSRRRDEERINRSIERSYERYRDHSFDKSKDRSIVITQILSPKPSPITISRVEVSQNTDHSQKKSAHGYYSDVDNHKQHTYLSRMGEFNRDAKETLAQLQEQSGSKDDSKYFNGPEQRNVTYTNPTNKTTTRGEQPIVNNFENLYSQVNQARTSRAVTKEDEEQEKAESIRLLRSRYNNLMRESLERKADKQMEILRQGNRNNEQ